MTRQDATDERVAFMIANRQMLELSAALYREASADKIDKLLVGAVVCVRRRLLLVRRSSTDEFLPGYMEIPGGGVETSETILEGLERELFEETHLTIQKIVKYVGLFDAVSPDGRSVRQFNFLVEPSTDKVSLSEEHSDYVWWEISLREPPGPMIASIVMVLANAIGLMKKGG